MIIQTSNLYFISSKYLANMLKGIIIQKNIHFCMRVSRCTTAKLFPISVSYLSRPICPLYLFWINITNNNRGFLNEKRRCATSRVTRLIIQSIYSINPNAYFLFYYYHILYYSKNNRSLIILWHIPSMGSFFGIQSKYCESIHNNIVYIKLNIIWHQGSK